MLHPGYDALPTPAELLSCVCPACEQVCLGPVFLGCGHHHCKLCLDHTGHCLICGEVGTSEQAKDLSGPEHQLLLNIYAQLRVRCRACGDDVPRGLNAELFAGHVAVCVTECTHCKTRVERRAFADHLEQCSERPRKCSGAKVGCPYRDRSVEVQAHERCCHLAKVRDALDNRVTHDQLKNKLNRRLAPIQEAVEHELEAFCDTIQDLVEKTLAAQQALIDQLQAQLSQLASQKTKTYRFSSQGEDTFWNFPSIGLSQPEPGHRWTAASRVEFTITCPGRRIVRIAFPGTSALRDQTITITLNGVEVMELAYAGDAHKRIEVDVPQCQEVILEIAIPDAASPLALGWSQDPRMLGIAFRKAKITTIAE